MNCSDGDTCRSISFAQIEFKGTGMPGEALKCNSVNERHKKWVFWMSGLQAMERGDGGGCPGSDRGCCNKAKTQRKRYK